MTQQLKRILAAAAEGTGDYPVSPDAAIYLGVPIFKTGEFFPAYPPVKVTVDEGYLAALAASYDPQFYCATINCDHDYWWGPAQGLVLALRAEGGVLYADLAITDYWLAQEIDRGAWPARSIEWHDADHAGGEKYYGIHDLYLTGLALLGQREPAVPGLGPMPARQPDARDQSVPDEPRYYALPLAAQSARQHSVLSFAGGARVPHTPEEGEMPGSPTVGAPPDPAKELAAAQARIAELEAKAGELEASNQSTLQAQLSAAQQRETELAARVQILEAAEAERAKAAAVEGAIAELKAGRYVTPATEADVRALLEAAHGNQAAWDAALKATRSAGPQYAAGPIAVGGDTASALDGLTPEALKAACAASGMTPEELQAALRQGGQK